MDDRTFDRSLFMLSTATKMSVARGIYSALRIPRRLFGGQDQVETVRRGVRWRLDLREGIDLTIYLVGAFERPTLSQLERLVQPGMNVVDIGANVGAHTLHLARLVGPQGAVFAFEPTSFAVLKLRENLSANPELAVRVEVQQCFLVGEAEAPVQPYIASSWPVDGTRPEDKVLGSIGMSTTGAEALTLDDALRASSGRRIGLMKIDVDGYELGVLRGGLGVLKRDLPVLVMELAPYVFRRPEDFDGVLELLWSLDYDLVPIGGRKVLPRDVRAVRGKIPTAGSMNVTATPRGRGGPLIGRFVGLSGSRPSPWMTASLRDRRDKGSTPCLP